MKMHLDNIFNIIHLNEHIKVEYISDHIFIYINLTIVIFTSYKFLLVKKKKKSCLKIIMKNCNV
jgi:hypothetical protein